MCHMKTVAFVQARMSSNRFPGKVLADLCGEPMIISMLSRVKKAKSLDNIVLVTSVEESDDCLASSVRDHGFPVFRGPLKNVLERFVQAAEVYPAEQYVRLTGDCPQVDPKIIDQVVTLLNDEIADYASNVEPPT